MNLARYGSADAGDPQLSTVTGAVLPSEALSAATGSLHERPKYVFGLSRRGRRIQRTVSYGYDYEAYANANTPGAEAYGYQDATRGGYLTGAYGD